MAGNTFGKLFTLTTFGESHGEAIGGIIDGCPAGIELDLDAVHRDMNVASRDNQKLLPSVKSRIVFSFFLEYLKEKPRVLQ